MPVPSSAQPIVLENEHCRAEFDRKSGRLLRLASKATGWEVTRRSDLGLSFRMLAPLPGRRDNPVLGEKQLLASAEVDESGSKATFTWRNLRSERGGELDITFAGTVTLGELGLQFDGHVANHSPHVVEEVSWPYFGDVDTPEGEQVLDRLSYNYSGMERRSMLPVFSATLPYFSTSYPLMLIDFPFTPFVLLDTGTQGLYLGVHDDSLKELVTFAAEVRPGFPAGMTSSAGRLAPDREIDGQPNRIEVTCWHFPYVQPGQSRELSTIVASPYQGTWHKGADVYKAWRKTRREVPALPAWAADVHSWQQIQVNSPEDELRCRYTDLVKHVEQCAEHGVRAIQLVGWNNGGQDRGNPSHDTDPRLGTHEELRQAIAKAHSMGVRIILFSKFTWADRSQEWFRKELVNHACTDPFGDYYVSPGYCYLTPTQLAGLNPRPLVPMCQADAGWREIADREFTKVVDLGAAGMLYDECQHHGQAKYCFNPQHGHRVPAFVYAGDKDLVEGFRRITSERKADFVFGGEACYDLQYGQYDISYFRIGHPDFIPLQRYVDPQQQIMAAVIGFNDRHTLNQCLMFRFIISYEPYQFKGSLSDFPRTVEYGKKIDALRRRYRAFLWEGEYRDTQDAVVLADGRPHPHWSVFRAADGKRAAVVTNFNDDSTLVCTVEFPGTAEARQMVATPEQPEAKANAGPVTIPPQSVAVIFEGK